MTTKQSTLLALWAACKVRALVWRAQALGDAMRREQARPPVKTIKRATQRRSGGGR